ncbi:MAG: adenosylcobinamide-GDP ribazoletransferase [Armatimonadota bacterium]
MTTPGTEHVEAPQYEPRPPAWRLHLTLAVTFLTRLPLPVRCEVTPADLHASMAWYPLVGLGLGVLGWLLFTLINLVLPWTVAAVLVIVLLEMATGALHLDGFMDTCDGIGSGKPRERALEIMKDSRVGAMGVFGAIAVLLVKVSALDALPDSRTILSTLVIGWTAARVLPLYNVLLFPYARETGTGKPFVRRGPRWQLLRATVVALIVGFLFNGLDGILLAAAVIALPLLVQQAIARKLGGLTGDVYGLGIELAEAVALLGGCVLAQYSLNDLLMWLGLSLLF